MVELIKTITVLMLILMLMLIMLLIMIIIIVMVIMMIIRCQQRVGLVAELVTSEEVVAGMVGMVQVPRGDEELFLTLALSSSPINSHGE